MILFRHADPRRPFFWESRRQPPARWHDEGDGPVQYLSDTPDAAWAEFLRHEEIRDAQDLAGIERTLWAVEITDEESATPRLARRTMTGGPETYPRCRREAKRLREAGADRLVAPCAALVRGTPSGWRTDRGLVAGEPREERTYALFGRFPNVTAWVAAESGRPPVGLLRRVARF